MKHNYLSLMMMDLRKKEYCQCPPPSTMISSSATFERSNLSVEVAYAPKVNSWYSSICKVHVFPCMYCIIMIPQAPYITLPHEIQLHTHVHITY